MRILKTEYLTYLIIVLVVFSDYELELENYKKIKYEI